MGDCESNFRFVAKEPVRVDSGLLASIVGASGNLFVRVRGPIHVIDFLVAAFQGVQLGFFASSFSGISSEMTLSLATKFS